MKTPYTIEEVQFWANRLGMPCRTIEEFNKVLLLLEAPPIVDMLSDQETRDAVHSAMMGNGEEPPVQPNGEDAKKRYEERQREAKEKGLIYLEFGRQQPKPSNGDKIRNVQEEMERIREDRRKTYRQHESNRKKKRKELSTSLVSVTPTYLESTMNPQFDMEGIRHTLPESDEVSIYVPNCAVEKTIITKEVMTKTLDVLMPIIGTERFVSGKKEFVEVELDKEDLRRYVGMTYKEGTRITDETLKTLMFGLAFWHNRRYAMPNPLRKDTWICNPLVSVLHTSESTMKLTIWLLPFSGEKNGTKFLPTMTKQIRHITDGNEAMTNLKKVVALTKNHMAEEELLEKVFHLSEKNPESVRRNMAYYKKRLDSMMSELKDEGVIVNGKHYENKNGKWIWQWKKTF